MTVLLMKYHLKKKKN